MDQSWIIDDGYKFQCAKAMPIQIKYIANAWTYVSDKRKMKSK